MFIGQVESVRIRSAAQSYYQKRLQFMREVQESRAAQIERLRLTLKGHSVFLVESPVLVEAQKDLCVEVFDMNAETGDQIPQDLNDFMDQHGIESAVVHIAAFSEERPVVDAYRAGKK
ncbi:MAG TPA: hypothetical protein VMR77_03435 [Patescibacteria group bacterium]|jgi:hypothetical protein|nr:hypothetical protein [Patescibacteria group bacterium]